MHFMVRLPEDAPPVDVSEENRIRIQGIAQRSRANLDATG